MLAALLRKLSFVRHIPVQSRDISVGFTISSFMHFEYFV